MESQLYEKEVKIIESLIVNSELNNEPGSLIYSSIETLKKSNIYFLGLNPGGVPEDKFTVLEHFRFMLDDKNKNFNEYCDGVWKPGGVIRTKGKAILQQRVQFLLSSLAINTRKVFASNLIFKRTRNEAELSNIKKWAEICWAIHLRFLSSVDPSLLVVMGNFCFNFIRGKMVDTCNYNSYNSGHANWECEFIEGTLANKKRKLVKIPHLSRYDIKSNPSVISWIKLLGLESKQI